MQFVLARNKHQFVPFSHDFLITAKLKFNKNLQKKENVNFQ